MFLVILLFFQTIPLNARAIDDLTGVSLSESTTEADDLEELPFETETEEEKEVFILSELTDKRSENTKTFRLSNGVNRAVSYPEAVHFVNADGIMTEYDNTLIVSQGESGETLAPAVSNSGVSIETENGSIGFVRVQTDENVITWNYVGASSGRYEISDREPDDDPQTLEKLVSEVVFPEAYKNVDLQYIFCSGKLKENLVLSSSDVPSEYTVHYSCEGAQPVLSDDAGTISMVNGGGEVVLTVNAPFATDALGEYCTGISYDIVNCDENGFDAVLSIDEEWLYGKDRSFPVVIDPIIITKQNLSDPVSQSAHVASGTPTATYGQGGSNYVGSLYAGYMSGEKIMRTYIKFGLPQLGNSDRIVYAEMLMYLTNAGTLSVTLHNVNSDWNQSTINWNNKPGCNESVVDEYKTFSGGPEGSFIDFEITKQVDEWYSGMANYGLMMKSTNESSANYVRFYSTSYPTYASLRPLLVIEYRNTSGYEDYYSYLGFDSGRGGRADVNVYNGNLVVSQPVTVDNGGIRMPVRLNAIYNANKGSEETGRIGNGWKLNYQMYIRPNQYITSNSTDEEKKYKYYFEDGDGTKHYFYFSDLNGTGGTDEDGLGYNLTVNTSVAENNRMDVRYTITDKNGGKMEFNGYGNLRYLRDTNSNCVTLNYDGVETAQGHYERLRTVTDGAGRTYNLYFYNAWPTYINYITDPSGRITDFSTSSSLLQSIDYPDENAVSFTYDGTSQQSLSSIIDPNGTAVTVSYTSGVIKRVNYLKLVHGANQAQSYEFNYYQNSTKVTDISSQIYSYQFNSYGQTTGVVGENNREAVSYAYEPGYDTSPSANKLTLKSQVQQSVDNYAKNPGFNVNAAQYSLFKSVPADASSWNYDASYGHYGAGSIHVAQPAGVAGYVFAIQAVYVPAGTYTVSAYVSTKNVSIPVDTPFLSVEVRNSTSHITSYDAERIGATGMDNWVRQSVTLTLTSGQYLRILLGFVQGAVGEAWFDDVQVERGYGESSFNILENPQFRTGINSVWETSSGSITLPSANTGTNAMQFASVPGEMSSPRTVSQTVKFNGSAGQVFSFGAWAQANSVPLIIDKSASGSQWAVFRLQITLIQGNRKQTETLEFNPYVSGLQFVCGSVAANFNFSQVKITFDYSYNANTAQFSGAYCLAEEFGESYSYDVNGNLVSSADAAKVDNSYVYAANNLTSAQSDTRSGSLATYDEDTNNLNYVFNTENQLYTYDYDSNGNLISAMVDTAGFTTALQTNHTYYIINSETGKALTAEGTNSPYTIINKSFVKNNSLMKWTLTSGGENGVYHLKLNGTTSYLAVDGSGNGMDAVYAKTNVTGTDQSFFKLVLMDDGSFQLRSKSSGYGYAVDAHKYDYETVSDGYAVYQFVSGNRNRSQNWYFFDVSASYDYMQATATYYTNGNFPKILTDVNGNNTQYSYNLQKGTITKTIDPKGYQTDYSYDSMSRPTAVTRYGLSAGYVYSNDLLSSVSTSGGTSYSFTYDDFGRLTGTSANGVSLANTTYDSYNRVHHNRVSDDSYTTYTYDNLDRLSTISYNDENITYSYGANGRLARSTDTASGTHTRYVYDLAGRMVQTREYTGTAVTGNTLKTALEYSFADGTNQVNTVVTKSALGTNTLGINYGDLTSARSSNYVYSETWNGTTAKTYSYDLLGRLSNNTTVISSGVTLPSTYTYKQETVGSTQTTALVETLQTAAGTYTYTYDANGNILSESCGGYTTSYVYNSHNMLVRENNQRAGYTYVYNYQYNANTDISGCNLVSRKTYAYTTSSLGTVLSTDTYTYGNSAWGDLLTGYNGRSISYSGARPCIYGNHTIDYYKAGLISEYTSGADVHNYSYDVSGKRISKNDNGVTTTFIYAGDILLGQQTGSNKLAFMFNSEGDVFGFTYNGTKYFYVKNLQGDVVALADSTGSIIARYYYDAWGRILSVQNSSGAEITNPASVALINPLRYRSYYYDSETGFYFLQSRYYDPEVGRFITADNVMSDIADDLRGYNLFAYCFNNPVNMSDNNGEWPSLATKVLIGAGAIVLGAAIVAATAVTGGAAAAFVGAAFAGLKAAALSGVIGAAVGAGTSAVGHRISTGSWSGSGESAVEGAINGFANGFMTGGITSGAGMAIGALCKTSPGIQIGKTAKSQYGKVNIGYGTPRTNGSTLVSVQNNAGQRLFSLDLDAMHAVHMHLPKVFPKVHIPVGAIFSGIYGGTK